MFSLRTTRVENSTTGLAWGKLISDFLMEMLSEEYLLREVLFTEWTVKRSLSSVCSEMNFQIP